MEKVSAIFRAAYLRFLVVSIFSGLASGGLIFFAFEQSVGGLKTAVDATNGRIEESAEWMRMNVAQLLEGQRGLHQELQGTRNDVTAVRDDILKAREDVLSRMDAVAETIRSLEDKRELQETRLWAAMRLQSDTLSGTLKDIDVLLKNLELAYSDL